MTDKEDRILQKNVDEMNQNTETLQEMKIYNAMRKGIMEGKKREKRRVYTAGLGVIAAAAAAYYLHTLQSGYLPRKWLNLQFKPPALKIQMILQRIVHFQG